MKFTLLSILLTWLTLVSCVQERKNEIILDVRAVINKTPQELVGMLGEPDSVYTERIMGKEIYCQRYLTYNIEIQYPDSLSTDIVIYGPHGLKFTQSALDAFDLPQQKHPSQYEKGTLMRWYDFEEFDAISFYNVQKDKAGNIVNFNIFFKAKPLPIQASRL